MGAHDSAVNDGRGAMTRKEYIELTVEDPVDMWGPDWKAILEELYEQEES